MFEFTLDLNGKFPFSISVLYKHFRVNDANRSTNEAAVKHAMQTEIKTTQFRNHILNIDLMLRVLILYISFGTYNLEKFVLMSSLGSNHAFTFNKPTQYVLDHGDYEITEILKRFNSEADAERGDTNRVISV